ncbi:hypothetical protein ABEW77_10960 [Heyndrickxia sporothermodurans]|uniref:hypothetical protein n=1 Tax=Heyndrickxia sporothermodurans TaxID=46224 RepID=UPI003D1B1CF0
MRFNLFRYEVVKRGLQDHVIEFTLNQKPYFMTMRKLTEIIEQESKEEKDFINQTISHIKLFNLDILEFAGFLAKSHVMKLTNTRRRNYESINNH